MPFVYGSAKLHNYKEQGFTEELQVLLFPVRVRWKIHGRCDLKTNFSHRVWKMRGFVVPPVLHSVFLAILIAN